MWHWRKIKWNANGWITRRCKKPLGYSLDGRLIADMFAQYKLTVHAIYWKQWPEWWITDEVPVRFRRKIRTVCVCVCMCVGRCLPKSIQLIHSPVGGVIGFCGWVITFFCIKYLRAFVYMCLSFLSFFSISFSLFPLAHSNKWNVGQDVTQWSHVHHLVVSCRLSLSNPFPFVPFTVLG